MNIGSWVLGLQEATTTRLSWCSGSGFGRTGTLSLKGALEKLDLGPCYHMLEVMGNPDHIPLWGQALTGRVDWDALFEGYGSTVDWPASAYWRELAEHFPRAKVVHSVRDADRWYESVRNTIYQVLARDVPDSAPQAFRDHQANTRELILTRTFRGRLEDRTFAIGIYEQHTEAVVKEIPAERLLVFDAKEGWEPLCRFLDRPVPDEPFPRVNSTDDFRSRFEIQTGDAGSS